MKKILILFLIVLNANIFNERFKEVEDCRKGGSSKICQFYKNDTEFFVNMINLYLQNQKDMGRKILKLEESLSLDKDEMILSKLDTCFAIIKHFNQ